MINVYQEGTDNASDPTTETSADDFVHQTDTSADSSAIDNSGPSEAQRINDSYFFESFGSSGSDDKLHDDIRKLENELFLRKWKEEMKKKERCRACSCFSR